MRGTNQTGPVLLVAAVLIEGATGATGATAEAGIVFRATIDTRASAAAVCKVSQ